MPVLPSPSPRRPLLGLLMGAVLVPMLVPGVAVADGPPASGDTVVGELVQAWPEHENRAEAVAAAGEGPLSWIETPSGETVRVSTADLAGSLPGAGVPVGATVEVVVGGEAVDDPGTDDGLEPALEVFSAEIVTAPPADEPPLAAAATDQVTIVMVVPAGGTVEPGRTLAQVETALNGPVAAFWSGQSGGAIRITTAAGNDPTWYYAAADCSNPYALWNEAAARVGWTAGTGKHLLVYLPRNSAGCAYGLAQVGNSVTGGGKLYVTDVATSAVAHELGHNFGLGHSSGRQCDLGTETGSCRSEAYRDFYDVMGYSWSQVGTLSAAQAVRLGLLPTGQQQTVANPGRSSDYTLNPVSGTTGTRALKLVAPDGTVYWLEYRTASGQDAWLAGSPMGLQTGVLLRRSAPFPTSSFYSDTSVLLDATPSPASGWSADLQVALPVGVPVGVSGTNFTVTLQSADATGAVVRVAQLAGDTACAGRASVSMSGVSMLTVGGTTGALVVGLDRGLWFRPIDGAANSWQSLGGGVLYGPAGVTAGSTSYAFVTGLDGALFYRSDDGGGWSPWTRLGGYLTASPSAASLGAGHVRVFGRGLDGQLWSRELQNGAWSGWVAHGGFLTSPPTATADLTSGRIDVLVRGMDGQIYEQSLAAGDGATPYQRRQVVACSAMALSAVTDPGDPASGAFVDSRGTPKLLESGGSRSLGGAVTSTPAVQFPGGAVVLAGRGLDNALWLYDGRSGTPGWRSLGGYVL